MAVLAGFAVGLYFYRSGSADARLLIWRVSLDMIADRPLTGFGPGNFPRYYMLYQADWFRAHPDSEFAAVADNAVYSFNEYIKLAVEEGLPGLLLFVAAPSRIRLLFVSKRQAAARLAHASDHRYCSS